MSKKPTKSPTKRRAIGTSSDANPQNEPIAVVGMACRFPGGANTPSKYWRLLDEGKNAIVPFPEGRWDFDEFYDPTPGKLGRMYNHSGGFLQDDLRGFDPGFFGISPREAKTLDPQQRIALELSWEAIENAGINPDTLVGSAAAVYLGAMVMDFSLNAVFNGDVSTIDPYCVSGNTPSVFAGRISYTYGWEGPTMMVDTACSASLVATHMAIRSLRQGESDLALAGAVILNLRPEANIAFGQLSMLSPDCQCKTFDASANGYARSEGGGVVLLKRLSDAIADGDTILATLRGSAINHDGRAGGLTVPSRTAQENLIKSALTDASITPKDIDYIEAHGTGTPLGDPIEVHALKNVFAESRSEERPLTIGSVKTNIGHLEPASGVAGLIKTILALQNEKIPRHLNFNEWNPHIQRDGFNVQIPLEEQEWKRTDGHERLAGVSSFGFSGTNAHVIVGEAPNIDEVRPETNKSFHILTISAKNDEAVDSLAESYKATLDAPVDARGDDRDFRDVARTSNIGRSHMQHRMAIVGTSKEEIEKRLESGKGAGIFRGVGSKAERKIGFLFTGQGSQYSQMGKELYETEPVFKKTMDHLEALFLSLRGESLLEVLFAENDDRINETGYTQPAIFAIQASLVDLWASYGITPDAVLGHSVGEFAAAYAAGLIGLDESFALITERGRLMQELPSGGAMATVLAPEHRVREALEVFEGDLDLAAVNGPDNVVVSGPEEDVDRFLAMFERENVHTQKLSVSHAFHSAMMDPMLDALEALGSSFTYGEPKVHFISNLTGKPVRPGEMSGKHWRDHARGAVLFAQGMKTAAEVSKCDVFLEIGPQPTLCATGRQTVTSDDVSWVPSLRRGKGASLAMTEAVARLYSLGVNIDWTGFHRGDTSHRAVLPNYAYQKTDYWVDMPKLAGGKSGHGAHPLLGKRLKTAGKEIFFESSVNPDSPGYLKDHCVFGAAVFPGAGYFEMALRVAAELQNGKRWRVVEFGVEAPLVLQEREDCHLQVVVDEPDQSGKRTLEIFTLNGDDWTRHAICRLEPTTGESEDKVHTFDELRELCPTERDIAEGYEIFRDHGLEYGPQFQGVVALQQGKDSSFATLAVPEGSASYGLHPALLDAALQTVAGLRDIDDDEIYLPVGLDSIELVGQIDPEAENVYCHAWLEDDSNPDLITGHIDIYNGDGERIAMIRALRGRRANRRIVMRALGLQQATNLFEIGWRRSQAPTFEPAPGERWAIIGDSTGVADALAMRLKESGQEVIQIADDAEIADKLADIGEVKGVIYMAALDAPAGEHTGEGIEEYQARITRGGLALIHTLGRGDRATRLWFVTRGGAPVDGTAAEVSPLQSMVWGFGRVVATEHSEMAPVMVDIDPTDDLDNAVETVYAELGNDGKESQVGYRTGTRWVPRLRATRAPSRSDDPKQLAVGQLGSLETLHWAPIEKTTAGPGEVKVRIRAIGMNFRDVLKALDFYPEADRALGDECAGEIVEVGEGVDKFKVGQRVLLSHPGVCFRTHLIMDADHVIVPLPENLSYAQAVTIPIAFVTAFYSLTQFGKVKPGERVLIHAGAGGVGLAAIQLARFGGAEVFATAGSERKRRYLREVLGVEHVMDSRSLDFADEIMEITNGEGIDVVLNSLIGESLQKSLSVLREGGRFLEIGKTELWDSEEIAKKYPNVTYFAIALDKILSPGPESRKGLENLVGAFARGDFQPLPWRAFPADRVIDAFRYMQGARHIGKVVITDYEDDRAPVREDGSYLITGGLGGLGLEVARHFAQNGAGAVVLMGRSAPKQHALEAIAQFEAVGCRVHVAQGDVSKKEDVDRIFAELDESDLPRLRGVVHAAGVLDDRPILEQDEESFTKVLGPKVVGGWNLHTATRGRPLDFMALFSSISTVIGNYSQANYSAANAFLDALAHHRASQGMPAASINWGAWAGAGMADDEKLKKGLKSLGMDMLDPEFGLELMDSTLQRGFPQITAASVRWERFLQFLGSDAPFYSELVKADGNGAPKFALITKEELLAKLKEVPEANRGQYLYEFLEELVMKALEMPEGARIDPDTPLQDLGFDSMMAVEMGNALSAAVGFKLSATVGFDHPTPRALGEFIASKLLPEVEGYQPPAETPTEEEPNVAEQLAAQQREVEDEVAELDDEELERSLERELGETVYVAKGADEA